jgi:diaminohydroxyphosphoribosylaminopyrimidine deaminase/5-amino-6-(5-phosphoribosylamino)uracil reductase
LKKADMEYMQRAIELATQARGRTSPNPMVGAVIVKDGKIIGEGYHKKAGTPHAEIHALAAAGNEARGATLYVSLEPCCHHGRTPPCTEAIINSGIKRVVIAALDPNPKVAGGGLQRLKEAGIDAEFGLMQEAAMELNAVFFKYIQRALPYVALKTAMTLDGKIAAGSGDSRWITGPEARQHVHQLRNIYDAIMVGIGTVLADNPRLNTRLQEGQGRDPVRVIIDNQLDLPVNSIIAQSMVLGAGRSWARTIKTMVTLAMGGRCSSFSRGNTFSMIPFLSPKTVIITRSPVNTFCFNFPLSLLSYILPSSS